MIATTIGGFVAAVVFTTGRTMAMSDEFPTKVACEQSVSYKLLVDSAKKTETQNKIICTNQVDIK